MAGKGTQTPPWWYDGAPVPWTARLLAPLYGAVAGLRRGFYRRGWLRSRQVPVPVIVVGNITAGGTGKTPLTIALVERLRLQVELLRGLRRLRVECASPTFAIAERRDQHQTTAGDEHDVV